MDKLGTLAVTSDRSTLILFTQMMEATRSSVTFVLTATHRNIPEDGILLAIFWAEVLARTAI
jgi:hypothetical protein